MEKHDLQPDSTIRLRNALRRVAPHQKGRSRGRFVGSGGAGKIM
jgi:hypothetical protein